MDSGKFDEDEEIKAWAKKQWASKEGPIFCHEGRVEHIDVEYIANAPLLEATVIRRKYAVRLDPQFEVSEAS